MDPDAIKRVFKRLLHSSYMIDILNLLRITPITEEQIALLLHFSHFLPIIFIYDGYSNSIINAVDVRRGLLHRIMCHESKITASTEWEDFRRCVFS